tara:strand:+ start:193 stop:618 length:426 start_codon:yes stop_codon:yes gene_type:complete
MRKIYRNIITEKEAKILEDLENTKLLQVQNSVVRKIIDKLKEDFNFTIKEKSYSYIERYPRGHGWHIDIGNEGHMQWCEVGASILLKEPESGGDTYYGDDINGTNKIKSDRKIYDLIAHTSDEYHMVEPHKGDRTVFLLFI